MTNFTSNAPMIADIFEANRIPVTLYQAPTSIPCDGAAFCDVVSMTNVMATFHHYSDGDINAVLDDCLEGFQETDDKYSYANHFPGVGDVIRFGNLFYRKVKDGWQKENVELKQPVACTPTTIYPDASGRMHNLYTIRIYQDYKGSHEMPDVQNDNFPATWTESFMDYLDKDRKVMVDEFIQKVEKDWYVYQNRLAHPFQDGDILVINCSYYKRVDGTWTFIGDDPFVY